MSRRRARIRARGLIRTRLDTVCIRTDQKAPREADSNCDSNATAHRANAAPDGTRGSLSFRHTTYSWAELIRMRSLGANLGATRANDFPRQANGCGQAGADHASSRTGPDDAERLTGIYGSEDWEFGSFLYRSKTTARCLNWGFMGSATLPGSTR